MGNCNCIDLQKPILWMDDDDDDWGAPSPPESESPHCPQIKQKPLQRASTATEHAAEENRGGAGSTEIKIKISKKQLEELLRQVDEQGLPLKKVLEDLVLLGGISLESKLDGHWRPNLQSIPEISE